MRWLAALTIAGVLGLAPIVFAQAPRDATPNPPRPERRMDIPALPPEIPSTVPDELSGIGRATGRVLEVDHVRGRLVLQTNAGAQPLWMQPALLRDVKPGVEITVTFYTRSPLAEALGGARAATTTR